MPQSSLSIATKKPTPECGWRSFSDNSRKGVSDFWCAGILQRIFRLCQFGSRICHSLGEQHNEPLCWALCGAGSVSGAADVCGTNPATRCAEDGSDCGYG